MIRYNNVPLESAEGGTTYGLCMDRTALNQHGTRIPQTPEDHGVRADQIASCPPPKQVLSRVVVSP